VEKELQQQIEGQQGGDGLGDRAGTTAGVGHAEKVSRGAATGKEPTIVFIHGAGISSWMWRQQLAALVGFKGLAVELPGHGTSPAPWVSVPDAADAVARFIRQQVPGGKAHVVGLSLGGVVALQLLAQNPDTVDRMLVSGTLATGIAGARALAGLTALTLPVSKFGPMVRLTAKMMAVPPADYPSLQADVERLAAGPLHRMILDVTTFRPPPVLAERHHQVFVVAGSKEHRKIRESVARLVALMPNARGGLIPGGVHTWNWQLPERFNTLVDAWCRDGHVGDFVTQNT
jgi:pimeloyl-ACP methyl ester carboxylesterase